MKHFATVAGLLALPLAVNAHAIGDVSDLLYLNEQGQLLRREPDFASSADLNYGSEWQALDKRLINEEALSSTASRASSELAKKDPMKFVKSRIEYRNKGLSEARKQREVLETKLSSMSARKSLSPQKRAELEKELEHWNSRIRRHQARLEIRKHQLDRLKKGKKTDKREQFKKLEEDRKKQEEELKKKEQAMASGPDKKSPQKGMMGGMYDWGKGFWERQGGKKPSGASAAA